VIARIDVDFTKAPHRLSPEFVEALREALCQLGVAHEQGREPPLLHERMIERKDDCVVVDDVEWMPELAGVANARDRSSRHGPRCSRRLRRMSSSTGSSRLPASYELWFYTNVAEPKPPQGTKLI
jgi:hypothetical protein